MASAIAPSSVVDVPKTDTTSRKIARKSPRMPLIKDPMHPNTFFTSLPVEIWLMIASNLERVDPRVSHGARGYASCLEGDRSNVCRTGIRLNADFILCEVCWTDFLLGQRCKSRHGPAYLLRDSFHKTFTHNVSIKWHNRKHLVLTQRSELGIKISAKKSNSGTKQTSFERTASADRILGRAPWCCMPHYDVVQSGIDCKLAHFENTQKHPWTIHFKHTSSCGCCGAFYVYSIERDGTDDLLVVTRYQDLSDIAVYAATLHQLHRPASSMG